MEHESNLHIALAAKNIEVFFKKLLFITVFFMPSLSGTASPKDSTIALRQNKKIDFRVLPLANYAPETGLLVGIGEIMSFNLHEDSITHYSLITGNVAYTQDKQDYVYLHYQFWTKNNDYYLECESDYYNYNYSYWGIGDARVPKEVYYVRFPKIYANAYKKITSNFYMGIDYYYEDDVIVSTQPGGVLSSGEITGSKGGVISGSGIDLIYDTRDNIYFPKHGWYIKETSYFNEPQLGSTFKFGRLITDASWYYPLSKPVVLALTQHNQLSWGEVPLNQLALVGGIRQIRGYPSGYYRDNALTYLQAETRIHLINRVGFVAFATMAFFGNYHTFPETPSPLFAKRGRTAL